jgi:hypothetical protein
MDYFIWTGDCSADPNLRHWHVQFPIWTMEEWTMCEGKPVENWREDLIAQYPPYGAPTDFPIVLSDWHVFSARLRGLIETEQPGDVQYLQFDLRSSLRNGTQITGYSVANHLVLLDCIDRERSESYSNWVPVNPIGDVGVEEPVLSRSRIGNHRLFRVKGESGTVVIRDDLKRRIENAGMTGCVFERIPLSD